MRHSYFFAFFVALLLSIGGVLAQQEPLINTYQLNQLPFNPAYAGVQNRASFDLHYRNQWGKLEGAPKTFLASGSLSLLNGQGGAGLSIVYDNIGVIRKTDINMSAAYHMNVSDLWKLSWGLQGGINAFHYDFSQLNLEDPTDADFVNADDAFTKGNIGTGLFLSSLNGYIGFSVPRLLNARETIDNETGTRFGRYYYLSAGYVFDRFNSIKVKPYFLLRMGENVPASFDLGASCIFVDTFWAGLYTRDLDLLGMNLFFQLNDGLRIGYSGEANFNDVAPSALSTHEISIGIDLRLLDNHEKQIRYY